MQKLWKFEALSRLENHCNCHKDLDLENVIYIITKNLVNVAQSGPVALNLEFLAEQFLLT